MAWLCYGGRSDEYVHHRIPNLILQIMRHGLEHTRLKKSTRNYRWVRVFNAARALEYAWSSLVHANSFLCESTSGNTDHLKPTWTELDDTLNACVTVAASLLLSKRRISSKGSQSSSKIKNCSSSKFERHIASQTLEVSNLTCWIVLIFTGRTEHLEQGKCMLV